MRLMISANFPPVEVLDRVGGKIYNEGWVYSLIEELRNNTEFDIHILYPQKSSDKLVIEKINDRYTLIGYYLQSEIDKGNQENIRHAVHKYIKSNHIDIVHIMGAEYYHSLSVFLACCDAGINEHVVVSIQGLVSYCAKHLDFGVPNIYKIGLTPIEICKNSSINSQKHQFFNRGKIEQELLSKCSNVIGRTRWDKICCKQINPDINYYYNSENLRAPFYSGETWSVKKCEKHSIFVSQATYPLKGFHHLLLALPQIVKVYPDTKVYVAGACGAAMPFWKRSSYGYYLTNIIKKYGLSANIVFCGKLNQNEMKKQYLRANVFVSPSNIENSSNSIAEAMILGVPVIASNVGGTSSILNDGIEGLLYPLTEKYVLEGMILKIFEDDNFATDISNNARDRAIKLYDKSKNIKELIDIYRKLEES